MGSYFLYRVDYMLYYREKIKGKETIMSVKSILSVIINIVVFAGLIAALIWVCMQAGIIEVATHRCMHNWLYDPYTTVSFMGTEIFRFNC